MNKNILNVSFYDDIMNEYLDSKNAILCNGKIYKNAKDFSDEKPVENVLVIFPPIEYKGGE